MNEGFSEQRPAHLISETQRRAIAGMADIRRRTQTLGVELQEVGKKAHGMSQPVRDLYDSQSRFVAGVINGAEQPDKEPKDLSKYEDVIPNLAALHYARAASLAQEASLPYEDLLTKAKKQLEKAREQGIPRDTPADYLPDAYILRIAKKATEGLTLPSSQTVAQYMQEDSSLLDDYALVLPEDQREEFLAVFPQEKQHEISVRLDRSVSSVLSGKVVTEPEHIEQRDAIKERVRAAFAHSLDKLKPTRDGEEKDFGGRALGSRWSSKQLTETLVNLDEKDSLQVLRDLSSQTTRELKAANKAKHLKKASLDEKQEALQPFLSFTGRVLHTLIEADTQRGGTLAMRYLETSALPERFFTFFSHKLVTEGYFNKSLTPFLQDNENIPVLKKLMAQYGKQFNTITDTLAQIPDYTKDHQLESHKEELFEALEDLGTLTPRIFERYRGKSPEERKEFAAKIRELKPKFFQNVPIKDILDPQDRDILTEMVYMAYKPNNKMTFEQVEGLIGKVDDHTEELEEYTFPREGYELNLEKSGGYVLKEGQKADLGMIRKYMNLFSVRPDYIEAEQEKEKTPFADALKAYLKPSESEDRRGQDEVLANLLHPLGKVYNEAVTDETAYHLENELAETVGHDFDEYYCDQVFEYITNHPDERAEVVKLLSDTQMHENFSNRLEKFNFEHWDLFKQYPSDIGLTVEAIRHLLRHEQIEPMRIQLESEMSKYTLSRPANGSAVGGEVKAYVSKNVGSFFAKAAADICTSDDVPLFERPDHFHINVVENDETVRGNNQAYIDDVEGKPALILRGFNPTAEWLAKIDPESYCEEIIRVGKEFAMENGLAGVYITEQDGGWHALSNREQIARYLTGKYTDGKEAVKHELQVSGGDGEKGHTVSRIYPV
jgi:hypothetical protein